MRTWVLCLKLFLSDGMLFSNISIWELNYYKRKVRQVIRTFMWKMYGRILLTYFIFLSFVQKGCTWAIPCYRYHIQRANFGTKTLSYILLLSNFFLFKICTSIHHKILNPLTPKSDLIDFTLSNTRRFCSSKGDSLGVKGSSTM